MSSLRLGSRRLTYSIRLKLRCSQPFWSELGTVMHPSLKPLSLNRHYKLPELFVQSLHSFDLSSELTVELHFKSGDAPVKTLDSTKSQVPIPQIASRVNYENQF